MNALRMPAAQTLLLFAHAIETNATFSRWIRLFSFRPAQIFKHNFSIRIICDSWLCLDFPLPESGQNLLLKASNLRRTWNKLLANKLESLSRNADTELMANQRATESNQLEADLWQNLAIYMNCEIGYTLKRLLPADLKVCNDESASQVSELIFQIVFRFRHFTSALYAIMMNFWYNSNRIHLPMTLNASKMM